MIGMSVEAMDEDDVDLRGFVGAVDLGEAVGFDFVWTRHLLVGRSPGGGSSIQQEDRMGNIWG